MTSRVFRLLLLATATAIVPIAIACGDDPPSIPEATTLPDGSVAAADATAGDDASGDDAAVDVTCPKVAPADAAAVFVATAGANTATCGGRDAPCKTINAGIKRAAAQGKKTVYVARGTYVEHVVMSAGVRVEGGWEPTWTRACVAANEAVVVRAPAADEMTIDARNLGGEAAIASLRVESKNGAAVATGESLYGVYAVGASTTLTLEDVLVSVGNAGGGSNGKTGTAGANAVAGCVAVGAGAAGAAGAIGAGAAAGAFGQSGWSAPAATIGVSGGPGEDGTAGGDKQCVQCGSCDVTCVFVPGTQACGTAGSPGCGGAAGGPGTPGTNGGSAVGVFAWDATVKMTGGVVIAGNGGSGGAGGGGGKGGDPTLGVAGTASATCTIGCNLVVTTCVELKGAAGGGTAGGAGGAGGVGGAGGGGAGGSSYAVYQGGTAIVTASETTLAHGAAGAGGGPAGAQGASGASGDRYP